MTARQPADGGTRLPVTPPVPGDFTRNKSGAPRVAHPTLMLKDGSRPKHVYYKRPSALGKSLGTSHLLGKYQARMVAVGMATQPALVDEAKALVGLTNDDPGFRETGDDIARRAQDAAKAGLAADRGTHVHALTEDHDNEADPIARMERGETLGLPTEAQHALVEAWRLFLDTYGLEVLATEAKVINDDLRVAGTLDRIVRATRDLTIGYEVIAAGTVFVLDIKTGKLRVDDKTGHPQWWHDYAIQIHAYAAGRPYDTDTDTRGDWPWQVDQRLAAICHLDVRAALAGEAVATLVLVDLAAGRVGADLVMEVSAWEARTDLFVIGDAVRVPVATTTTNTQEDSDSGDHDQQQAGQVAGLGRGGAGVDPVDDGTPAAGPREVRDVDGVRSGRDGASLAAATPLTRADELAQVPTRTPDEGDTPHTLESDLWREMYDTIRTGNPAAASWIGELSKQATAALVPFHFKHGDEVRITTRRLWILAGLVRMANAGHDTDDMLRRLLATTVDADWPLFANVRPGHALGTLDATEAQVFAGLADLLACDDGTMRAALAALTAA